MLEDSSHRGNLSWLKCEFDKLAAGNTDTALQMAMVSKLSIIELSGWIEEVRDGLISDLAFMLFDDVERAQAESKRISKGVNGFRYKEHFIEKVFEPLLGCYGAKLFEDSFENQGRDDLASSLGSLWTVRCECAHRSIEGVTLTLQPPSWCLQEFDRIRAGMLKMERSILSVANVIIERKSGVSILWDDDCR